MQCVIYFIPITLLIVLISNPKDSSHGWDISGHELYEPIIKFCKCLSESSNKFPNNVSTEIENIENTNIRYNTYFDYSMDITSIVTKGKNTMIITDSLLYLNHYQYYFKCSYHIVTTNLENILMNNYNFSHYLYLGKFISKQPYQYECFVSSKSYPKSSILISLILLMCGDTGTLLNPGPVYRNIASKCGICDRNIRSNSRFIS